MVLVKSFLRFAVAYTTMLSKNDIKFIRSLEQVKYRRKHRSFIAEGRKVINEFIDSGLASKKIFTTSVGEFGNEVDVIEVSERELKQISFHSSPQGNLAIFEIPEMKLPESSDFKNNFGIVCDCIQDPGNLGTIIRIADWFGIEHIICSSDSVDAYNPKVVQASMGSLARVKVSSVELSEFFSSMGNSVPVISTSLEGQNIYETQLPKNGLLVLGNESKGVSEEMESRTSLQVMIPRLGGAESLNVAVSAGILCAELKRPS